MQTPQHDPSRIPAFVAFGLTEADDAAAVELRSTVTLS